MITQAKYIICVLKLTNADLVWVVTISWNAPSQYTKIKCRKCLGRAVTHSCGRTVSAVLYYVVYSIFASPVPFAAFKPYRMLPLLFRCIMGYKQPPPSLHAQTALLCCLIITIESFDAPQTNWPWPLFKGNDQATTILHSLSVLMHKYVMCCRQFYSPRWTYSLHWNKGTPVPL